MVDGASSLAAFSRLGVSGCQGSVYALALRSSCKALNVRASEEGFM